MNLLDLKYATKSTRNISVLQRGGRVLPPVAKLKGGRIMPLFSNDNVRLVNLVALQKPLSIIVCTNLMIKIRTLKTYSQPRTQALLVNRKSRSIISSFLDYVDLVFFHPNL